MMMELELFVKTKLLRRNYFQKVKLFNKKKILFNSHLEKYSFQTIRIPNLTFLLNVKFTNKNKTVKTKFFTIQIDNIKCYVFLFFKY